MSILVQQQTQDIKRIIHTYMESFFDGSTHTVSGSATTVPDCTIRMVLKTAPQDSEDKLDKPLISFVMGSGDQVGNWSREKIASLVRRTKRQRISFSVYVMATTEQGGALQCDAITSLVKAILEATEAITLSQQGLKQITISPPSSINQVRDGYYLNVMLMNFHVNLDYN